MVTAKTTLSQQLEAYGNNSSITSCRTNIPGTFRAIFGNFRGISEFEFEFISSTISRGNSALDKGSNTAWLCPNLRANAFPLIISRTSSANAVTGHMGTAVEEKENHAKASPHQPTVVAVRQGILEHGGSKHFCIGISHGWSWQSRDLTTSLDTENDAANRQR